MTSAGISVLVPSRSRPGNIVELVDAWDSTATGGFAELVVAVDDDDPHLDAYRAVELPDWAELIVGPRLRLGGTLNNLAPIYARTSTAVGFLGDDHRPRSLRWDERIAVELARRPLSVVYGNDLIVGAGLPTAVFLDAVIVDELGYMVPPGMVHLYLDNYWRELGLRLGTLTYLADLIIEHVHPLAGRAAWDDQYREVNTPDLYAADEARYTRYVATELDPAVERLTNRTATGPAR